MSRWASAPISTHFPRPASNELHLSQGTVPGHLLADSPVCQSIGKEHLKRVFATSRGLKSRLGNNRGFQAKEIGEGPETLIILLRQCKTPNSASERASRSKIKFRDPKVVFANKSRRHPRRHKSEDIGKMQTVSTNIHRTS